MKKGWQKRFWKAGYSLKTDFNVDFGEFMFQMAIWWAVGVAVVGIIDYFLFKKTQMSFNIWHFVTLYMAGLIGAIIGWKIRNRKAK